VRGEDCFETIPKVVPENFWAACLIDATSNDAKVLGDL
jgi:hypothetical protein